MFGETCCKVRLGSAREERRRKSSGLPSGQKGDCSQVWLAWINSSHPCDAPHWELGLCCHIHLSRTVTFLWWNTSVIQRPKTKHLKPTFMTPQPLLDWPLCLDSHDWPVGSLIKLLISSPTSYFWNTYSVSGSLLVTKNADQWTRR